MVLVDQKEYNSMMSKLLGIDRFNEKIEKEITYKINKWQKNSTIIIMERKMIVKAMGFASGHWFKCPNGHPYAIADCGGAMERSKCPVCKAVIGGESHRLVAGNTLASEMDGATRPAWPS